MILVDTSVLIHLAQSIKEAREEYKRGKIRKGTVDDLMNELSK